MMVRLLFLFLCRFGSRSIRLPWLARSFFALAFLTLISCGGDSEDGKAAPLDDEDAAVAVEPAPAPEPEPDPVPTFWTEVELHRAIRKVNPGYSGQGQFRIEKGQVLGVQLPQCGISNLSPLKGMQLMQVDLQGCPVQSIEDLAGMPIQALYLDSTVVSDLSALKGMSTLQVLYADNTGVSDISPLQGLPITELNLVGTGISDLKALTGMPLRQLWLTDCKVSDLSPLSSSPLESITLHRTQVADLTPLAKIRTLQRLHIGETPVTDLTPLGTLPLQRLVFTPGGIVTGIDVIRKMPSLQQVGTEFADEVNTVVPAPVFWQKYDAGEFK
jgi:hypothetical protein